MNNRSGSPLLPEENTFGRFQFVWEAPGIALTSVLILAIAALVGTFGNLLILVSVCHTIKRKSLEFIFVGNLAVSDLFVTLIVDPINILGKLEGEKIFHYVPGFCRALACMCTISCVNSLGSIVLMSSSRYVSICHHNLYKRIFKRSTCFVMCLSLNLIGLLLILLNLAGIGDHSFDRKSLECIWDRMTTYYYTVSFTVIFVWVPVIVTGIFYCLIFIKFRASTKRISHSTSTEHNKRPMYLAKSLFLIYTAFVICWIPYAILVVADRNDSFSYEIHVLITTLAHLHPSFNWLVLYYTNTLFRNAFNKLVKFDKCFKKFSKENRQVGNETAVSTVMISNNSK